MRTDVQIPTSDGTAPGSLHTPDGDGPWPGVLMFTDAGGLRDVFRDMGDRLAGLGYAVLIPDTYYRSGDWEPFDIATLFTTPSERERMGTIAGPVLVPETLVSDAGAYADFLLARPEVSGTAIGTAGYCMGGWMSMTAATGLGERVAATASIHGGRIADPDSLSSPHHAARRIRATVYVAGAQDDASFTTVQASILDAALSGAGVEHTVEIYPAGHGFAVVDNPTYDEQAAQRHWDALENLYGRALRG